MLSGLGAVNYLLLSGKKTLHLRPAGNVCPLEKKGSGMLTKGSGEHTEKSSSMGDHVTEFTRAHVCDILATVVKREVK